AGVPDVLCRGLRPVAHRAAAVVHRAAIPETKTPRPKRGVSFAACGQCCLQVDAETRADRAVAAAERAAERERRTLDALAVADRQAAFAALEAGADGDATAFALGAGGVDRHVEHRRAHRAHA